MNLSNYLEKRQNECPKVPHLDIIVGNLKHKLSSLGKLSDDFNSELIAKMEHTYDYPGSGCMFYTAFSESIITVLICSNGSFVTNVY